MLRLFTGYHLRLVSRLVAGLLLGLGAAAVHGAEANGDDDADVTALFMAAREGHGDVVKLLHGQGGDIELGPEGFTPLMTACMNGHMDIVRYLLDCGAQLNIFGGGYTPLTAAVKHDRTEISLLLLERGAEPNYHNTSTTLLHDACLNGNARIAMALLEHGATVEPDSTAAGYAAQKGMTSVVAALVQRGGCSSYVYSNPETLEAMIAHGYGEIARLMLEASRQGRNVSASPRIERQEKLLTAAETGDVAQIENGLAVGQTHPDILALALEIARVNGNIEAAQCLNVARLQAAAPVVELHAVAERFASAARALEGDDVVERLVSAVQDGDAELVRSLLAQGADPAAVDASGVPVLQIAIERGHVAVFTLLLNAGEPVDITDSIGTTPLFEAAMRRQVEAMRLLLEHGADVTNERAIASLHYCASMNWTPELELLLQHHVDPNGRGQFGDTALLRAVERGSTEAVRVLLAHGADPNILDDQGQTPLSVAKLAGEPDVVRMLEAAGAREGTSPVRSPLFEAVNGDPARFRRMLESGADPDGRGISYGSETPLSHIVVWTEVTDNGLENAKLLLEFGADVNQSPGILIALAPTRRDNALTLARLLIEHGADPNSSGNYVTGDTPLTQAAQSGNLEMVRLLLQSGADAEKRRDDGQSPLDIARSEGYLKVVKLLEQWRAEHRQPAAPTSPGGKP